MKYLLLGLTLAGAGAWWYYASAPPEFEPEVRTVEVTRGDIVESVAATGALEAVTTVQVGSQVSGIIQDLYVDYNSIVREDDVIMRLDPSLFETQIAQARANLLRAEADVERLRVAVDDANTQHRRSIELAALDLIAATELEAAQVNVRSAEAQLKSAEAQVVQAEASLNQNQVNLDHTVIRSPIDGIVVSRLVDVGQTVAASLQAPELFVIAADLTKMRVIANVDESDVGRIRPQQHVSFVVDAYPDETFAGTVSQIRLEPIVQQNVVTYATVIDAPNPELKLKPGMTATATIEIARRTDVLRVPNVALRFRPTSETFMALNQPAPEPAGHRRIPQAADTAVALRRPAVPGSRWQTGSGPGDGGFRIRRRVRIGWTARSRNSMRRFRERMQQMSPEQREQLRARRGRGRRAAAPGVIAQRPGNANETAVPAVARGATTIDALFGPLPEPQSVGRVWLLGAGQLSAVDVTLGLTDGTSTELLQARPIATDQPAGEAIPAGTLLVNYLAIPDDGAAMGGLSSSPLIPQFGRGRRRR